MKLAPYPISHITNIVTLRALQLDKTCSHSAGSHSAQCAKPPHRKYTTSLGTVQSKQVQFWQNDKPAKGEYITADVGKVIQSVPNAFDTNRCKHEAPCDTCQPRQPAYSCLFLLLLISSFTLLPGKIRVERNGG